MTSTFLAPEDLVILTGRKMKSKQIEAIRQMGIPFFVNATGHPVVCRSAVEGGKEQVPSKPQWMPDVLRK